MTKTLGDNQDWYKDAVIYELHVRSFVDSNADGMGDFKGLTSRLDYLQDLGVSAVWVLPFYPSPWRDDGYDISDYTSIHQAYGNLRDFKRFLREAKARDLKVITELIINHTSSQHPWFERARRAKPGSKYRDFYVWSDTPERYPDARIIFQDFESSNWTWDAVARAYYWHRFYSHQPDLNFDNPEVQDAVLKLQDFWFNLGVDGLRLDAIPYLFERDGTNCENLPETHEFLKKMRAHTDTHHSGKMLLAEANQWPEDAVTYFGEGDECHMAFHFPLMPRLFMGLRMEDRFPVTDILEQTPAIPETSQWGIFLRNHDELTLEMVTDEERDYMYQAYGRDPRHRLNLGIRRRLAPLLDNNRRQIELLNSLLFSLPGTPVIYYGDEIGMGDNVYLGDRDGVRTPMQWSSDRNAGFSRANPQRLYLPVIIDPEYHYEALNVETQQANSSSLLWWMKRVIATRRRFEAFSRGSFELVNSDNTHVFSFIRRHEDEIILVIANFSRHTQVATLDLTDYVGYMPEEVFSRNEFPRIREEQYTVNVGSNDYYWFVLKPVKDYAEPEDDGRYPEIALGAREWSSFGPGLQETLEERVLLNYMSGARWYREKSRKVRRVHITDTISLGTGEDRCWITTVALDFTDDRTDTYVLPLATAKREDAERIVTDFPGAVLARFTMGDDTGVLYDAVYDEVFRDALLELMVGRKRLKGSSGQIDVFRSRNLRQLAQSDDGQLTSRVLKAEQSNTSILYKNALFFKLYRKLEVGLNPDVELLRFLSEKQHFPSVPAYAANLEYVRNGESSSLGMLVEFVPNEGDAWSYTESNVDLYFERLLAQKHEFSGVSFPVPSSLFDVTLEGIPQEFVGLADGFYLEMVDLLGRRTGEMHLALAAEGHEKAFAPESFSKLYQRSVYQSLRSLFRRVMSTVRKVKSSVDERVRPDIELLFQNEDAILAQFSRITERKIPAKKIRIHGDYHLGQVLFTGRDFIIIDLEGEPARTLSERRLKYSSFRDVAGMIRSFHYAIYGKYLHYAEVRPEDSEFLSEWVEPWYLYVSGVFLRAYLETVNGASFVPADQEDLATILDIFLLEKAVYEIGYEINNRPAWLSIPVRGVQYVLESMKRDDG